MWSSDHLKLIDDLRLKASERNYNLSDRFASTLINQTRTLAVICSNPNFGTQKSNS